MIQQHDIFPTSVFTTKSSNHDNVVAYIDEHIMPSYLDLQKSNTQACNVFSDYFAGAPRLDQEIFKEFYAEDIHNFLGTVGFANGASWNINSVYWYSITGKGGYQETHCHVGGPNIINFSAVHYVKFSEEHTPVRFFNPMEQIIKSISPSENDETNPFMFKNLWTIPPIKEGDLIFFPSYLKHDVPVQTSEKTRISIAMNIGVTINETIS